MKTYQSYKPSGVEWIGDIPNEWTISRLKWITNIENSGVWGEDNEFTNSVSVPIPTTGQLSIDGKWFYDKMNLRHLSINEWNKYKCVEGDIVVVKSSGSSTNIITGKCGFISNEDTEKFGFSNFLLRIRPTKINPKLLYYFLSSNLTKQRIERMVSSTTYPNLKVDEYSNSEILVPPLQEQQQIVKYLDEKTSIIDKLISTKERKIELLKEQRSSLINEVITKGLDPNVKMKDSGVEWIGEIPERWGIIPIRYLGTFQNGISKGSEYFGKGFPFMNYGDVYKYETTPDKVDGKVESSVEERERYSVIRGDIFFTRTSESKDDIGVSSVCLTTIKDCSFSGFVIRYRFHDEIHLPEFSKYHFQTYWKKVFIESKMNIVTRSSLSQQVLGQLPILIPNIDEQRQIVEYLDKHTKEIDVLVQMEQKKIELLKEYRQSLISEVITGKIKVVE